MIAENLAERRLKQVGRRVVTGDGTAAGIGNIRHNGKFPDGRQEKREKENKLNLLREKLNKAIENQEYEDAAKYRDEIRELEKNRADGNNNTEKEGA